MSASISSAGIRSSSSAAESRPGRFLACSLRLVVRLAASLVLLTSITAQAAPLDVTILTVRDELLPRAAPAVSPAPAELQRTPISFDTPADLSAPAFPGARISFRSEFPALNFEDVKAFLFRREARQWIGSEAPAMEWYRLGPLGNAAPPPPGWGRSFGNHAAWQRCVPAQVGAGSPYVNRAQACWTLEDAAHPEASGEFLFRFRFNVDRLSALESGRLVLGTRVEVLGLLLNDTPILTGPSSERPLQEFEIGPLLQYGVNVLGLWVRTRNPPPSSPPSIAFAFELVRTDRGSAPTPGQFDQAVLETRRGDRVVGNLVAFNPASVLMQTPYGRYGIEWEQVRSIAMPRGWLDPPAPEPQLAARMDRFFGLARPSASQLPRPFGILLTPPNTNGSPGLLLRDGRLLSDEPLSIRNRSLLVRREGSEEPAEVARAEIAAIFPPESDELPLERPSGRFGFLQCRLRTTRGEVYSGILRQVNSRRVVLEHTGDGILSFPPRDVVWIWFSQHRDRLSPLSPWQDEVSSEPATGRAGAKLALLALQGPDQPLSPEARRLQLDVQQAAFLAELEIEFPEPRVFADPARLNVRAYPAAVIADPDARYVDTLDVEGDVRSALVSYVESGGTLIVYARKGALRTPIRVAASPSGAAGPSLADQLNLRILVPDGETLRGERAFDAPPNLPVALQLKRAPTVPVGLGSLPLNIDVPSGSGAPFHPAVSADGAFETLYQLTSDTGTSFGPALILVRRGTGRIIVVDALLWEASIEGRPFSHVVLPQLLAWAADLPR